MTAGIYRIRNTVDGRAYIGSSINIAFRWATHRRDLRNGSHPRRALQHAWESLGEAAFAFEIIETLDAPEKTALLDAEQAAILAAVPGSLYNARVTKPVVTKLAAAERPSRIRVTLLRELGDRRMSLMDLQRRTGLSYSSLHAFAAGQTRRYDARALDKICAALGVGVGDIFEHVAGDQP